MSGTQEAPCRISMIVAVFPFQFISCTPHTCNSSAINLVATKKVRVLYVKTEVRFLLHLGRQWLVGSNKFISCTLNRIRTLRMVRDSLRQGNDYRPCPGKIAVSDSLYLVSHSWGFLSNSLLVHRHMVHGTHGTQNTWYTEHMLHAWCTTVAIGQL